MLLLLLDLLYKLVATCISVNSIIMTIIGGRAMIIIDFFAKHRKFFGSLFLIVLLVLLGFTVASVFYGNTIGTLADWVSGLGSVGAIAAVWWQSTTDIKRMEQSHEDEVRENRKQEVINYVGNLKDLRFQLIGFNTLLRKFIYLDGNESKPNYNVSLTELKFISSKINEMVSLCNYDLSKIIEFKNKDDDFKHARNIEVAFSVSILNAKNYLELQILKWEEAGELNSREVHDCLYDIYHNIIKYTKKCTCSRCINKKNNKNVNVLGREIEVVSNFINSFDEAQR